MICTLLAEAVVIAKRMIWTLLAEAVVIVVVAESMIWPPLAEKTHDNQFDAKTMTRMPATETTHMRLLRRSFGVALAFQVEQRRNRHGLGGRPGERWAR